jgi:nucleoid-associated protein YgaU
MTIRIDSPRSMDVVGDPVLISGIASGFEATVNYRVHEGHDEVVGFFNVGSGTGEHSQFQISVDVSGASFTLDRIFVEVFEESAEDGSEINKATVPVILGSRIVSGYLGYREHRVRSGETLGSIANQHYGDSSAYLLIVRANPTLIVDPDLIFPGQVFKVPIGT